MSRRFTLCKHTSSAINKAVQMKSPEPKKMNRKSDKHRPKIARGRIYE